MSRKDGSFGHPFFGTVMLITLIGIFAIWLLGSWEEQKKGPQNEPHNPHMNRLHPDPENGLQPNERTK